MISEKWKISREDLDRFGLRSQHNAARATKEGRFQNEIVPVLDAEGAMMSTDEGIRETSLEKLASLKPSFKPVEEGGRVTAGNSSQITDGSAALLIMSEEKAKKLGLKPRARFVSFALAAENPRYMLTAPIPATKKALERANLKMSDIDLVEINEAFAAVVLAWEKELHPDMDKVNVNGGASRSATRSVHRARDSRARCSTNSSAPAAAMACRRCARAAGSPTHSSSNASRPSQRRAPCSARSSGWRSDSRSYGSSGRWVSACCAA